MVYTYEYVECLWSIDGMYSIWKNSMFIYIRLMIVEKPIIWYQLYDGPKPSKWQIEYDFDMYARKWYT